jgi:hypothetical protein
MGYSVVRREAHPLLEELAEVTGRTDLPGFFGPSVTGEQRQLT